MSDWDRKMASIDKKLESISDDQLVGRAKTPAAADTGDIARARAETSTFGVFARLLLSVALGVGIVFWPYGSRCGVGLAAYLGAVTVVVASGVWSAVWTFRHRAGRAHVLSLLLVLWGMILGAQEVLPRVGYAVPTPQHPAAWYCQ
ncbi:MAG TPA: hypothetical protein VG432_03685 [Gemmatimonadaceae bacterium]|nr:hypothetical protein [Gemmatimonadaceae bacterium]